jgi:hypothetical protein
MGQNIGGLQYGLLNIKTAFVQAVFQFWLLFCWPGLGAYLLWFTTRKWNKTSVAFAVLILMQVAN